ncbi:MAG: hypothetical protein R2794_09050 [Chitinophagales bacterium]
MSELGHLYDMSDRRSGQKPIMLITLRRMLTATTVEEEWITGVKVQPNPAHQINTLSIYLPPVYSHYIPFSDQQ